MTHWWDAADDLADKLREHGILTDVVRETDLWRVEVANSPYVFRNMDGDQVVALLHGILVGLEVTGG